MVNTRRKINFREFFNSLLLTSLLLLQFSPALTANAQINNTGNVVDGATLNSRQQVISGTATPGGMVTVTVDTGTPITVPVNDQGNWTTQALNLTCGQHTIVETENAVATYTYTNGKLNNPDLRNRGFLFLESNTAINNDPNPYNFNISVAGDAYAGSNGIETNGVKVKSISIVNSQNRAYYLQEISKNSTTADFDITYVPIGSTNPVFGSITVNWPSTSADFNPQAFKINEAGNGVLAVRNTSNPSQTTIDFYRFSVSGNTANVVNSVVYSVSTSDQAAVYDSTISTDGQNTFFAIRNNSSQSVFVDGMVVKVPTASGAGSMISLNDNNSNTQINPFSISVNPGGTRLATTTFNENASSYANPSNIYIYNTGNLGLVSTLPRGAGDDVRAVTYSYNGSKLYVVDHTNNTLFNYNISGDTYTYNDSVQLQGAIPYGSHQIVATSDGKRLYITNGNHKTTGSAIDVQSGQSVNVVYLGSNGNVAGATIVNKVTSPGVDPVHIETTAITNTVTKTITINCYPDLVINKSHTGTAEVGGQVIFTIKTSNKANVGSVTTPNSIIVADPMPTELEYVSATGTNWDCTNSTTARMSCTYTGTYPVASPYTLPDISLTTKVKSWPASGKINNIAYVDTVDEDPSTGGSNTSQPEGATGDNTDPDELMVNAPKAQLGNYVWNDLDHDGVQDANEPGVSGVTVTLYDNNDNIIATTVTDSNGYYQFTNLNAGTYCVRFSIPSGGYVFTGQNQGGNDTTDSDANPNDGRVCNIVLNPGDSNQTIDAGIYVPLNPNLPDISIEKTHTDKFVKGSKAKFNFTIRNTGTILANGPLTVEDTLPAGLTYSSVMGAGWSCNANGQKVVCANTSNLAVGASTSFSMEVNISSSIADSVRNVATVSIPGEETTYANNTDDDQVTFTPNNNSSIGNYVWIDKDLDGIQDNDEVGLNDVTVHLLNCAGQILSTTKTTNGPDGKPGYYIFNNLAAGDYKIQIVLPSGYAYTKQYAGNDGSIDSNVDGNGMSACITLGANESNMSVDGGLYKGKDNLAPVNSKDFLTPTGRQQNLLGLNIIVLFGALFMISLVYNYNQKKALELNS